MKKILLFLGTLILLTGCGNKQILSFDGVNLDDISKIYELVDYEILEGNLIELYQDENIKVYSTFTGIKYIDKNGNKIDIKEALENNIITIDEIISKMEYYATENDGGSIFYRSINGLANVDFYLAKCNSGEEDNGSKDIFITTNKDKVFKYCNK